MICLNCKKQIPDSSASCPYCGNQIIHKEQLSEEIKFRRYQRWFFYGAIAVVFLGMLGVIIKIYKANTEYILSVNEYKKKYSETSDALNKTGAELDQTKSDLSAQAQLVAQMKTSLEEKEALAGETSAQLEQAKAELTKKTEDYKSILEEKMKISGAKDECELNLNSSDANIYSLIIKLGSGITNNDIAKIPVAASNLGVGTDTDGDGLSDVVEAALKTDKLKSDTDGDGYSDKDEILGGFNPAGPGQQKIDAAYANKVKGRIVLQVESNGEAWYVSPGDGKRYFLGTPADAFRVMRDLDYWTKDWKTENPVGQPADNASSSPSGEIIAPTE